MTGRPLRRDLENAGGDFELICPQCGKLFICWEVEPWVYKRGTRVFCSWKCYREVERGVRPHPETHAPKDGEPLSQKVEKKLRSTHDETYAQAVEVVELKKAGYSNSQIAEALGLTPGTVANRLNRYGRELGWEPMSRADAGRIGRKHRSKSKGKP